MRAGRTLRRLVADRIEAAVPELSGRVYDKATASALHPYATLGSSSWSGEDADCFDAREHSLQIDLWHSGTNKGALEDLTDDVASARRGFVDEDRLTMHPIEVTLVRVIDDPSGDVHGIVQIEVYLES